MTEPPFNVAAILDLHARAWADKPAVVAEETALPHRLFADRVRRTADRLAALGAVAGSRIGLALGDRPAHLVCLFAIARIGAVVVPMDVRWSEAEKARLTGALAPHFVLVEPQDAETSLGCPVHVVDADWETAVSAHAGATRVAATDDLPFIFSLSSGTTAAPSGPLLAHRHFYHRFVNQWVTLGVNAHDRFLAATPLYFGATRGFILATLQAGGTVCLNPPPYDIDTIPAAVARHGATSVFLVPTLLRRLLALDDKTLAPMRGMRALFSSGAALHPEERSAVAERICPNLYDYYGTTEGGGISVLGPADRDSGEGSVGRPVYQVEVQIIGPDDVPVGPGEVGRIRYRGPAMATGDTPAIGGHKATTDADGWFQPGDLGMVDERGFLHLRGRAKDLIVRGGVNVYPQEVEETLLALDGVVDAAVVGWPSAEFGEEVAAFVVARAPTADAAVLRTACHERLAPYKVPREIFILDSLPKNSSGKVRKDRLRDRLSPL